MVVSTRTVCPFPYVVPKGLNASSPSDCIVTYGAALGGVYTFCQAFLLAVGCFGMTLFGYRMILLRIYCRQKRARLSQHPVLIHLVLCFLFNFFLVLESIDLLGFRGVMPIEAYAILDEVLTSIGMTNALFTVAFLYNIVRGDAAQESRARVAPAAITVVIWMNFVGFITTGILDFTRYRLYEGLKILVGSLLFGAFCVLATTYAASLERLLRNNLRLAADKGALEDRIRMLRQRHMRLVLVLGIACLALLAGAIITLTSSAEWFWTVAFEDIPDPAQVIYKLILILNVILTVYLFRVPVVTSSSSGSLPTPNVALLPRKQAGIAPESKVPDGGQLMLVMSNPVFTIENDSPEV